MIVGRSFGGAENCRSATILQCTIADSNVACQMFAQKKRPLQEVFFSCLVEIRRYLILLLVLVLVLPLLLPLSLSSSRPSKPLNISSWTDFQRE